MSFFFFFFNDPATTEIYTLSLHDALPIFMLPSSAASMPLICRQMNGEADPLGMACVSPAPEVTADRSEEHTSELQSHVNLVCRLLLEKKKKKKKKEKKVHKQQLNSRQRL